MCKKYGYVRVSTQGDRQNTERQERNIKAVYPDAIIFGEKMSGRRMDNRTEFNRLRSILKSGDTLILDSVERMARNAQDGFTVYKELFEKGVEIVFLKHPHINTTTYKEAQEKQIKAITVGDEITDELIQGIVDAVNRYMLRLAEKQIYIAFENGEREVKELSTKVKEGQETARRHGKTIGHKVGTKLTVKKEAPAKDIIRKHSKTFGGSLKDKECATLAGVSLNTFYKYKREILEAEGAEPV